MARHSSVCHNLVVSSKSGSKSENAMEAEPTIQPVMPLRKPHASGGQGAKRDQPAQPSSGHQQRNGQHNNRGPRNNHNHNHNNNKYNNRHDKRTANNYNKNETVNGTDTNSFSYPKPSTTQSADAAVSNNYPKPSTNQSRIENGHPKPSISRPENVAEPNLYPKLLTSQPTNAVESSYRKMSVNQTVTSGPSSVSPSSTGPSSIGPSSIGPSRPSTRLPPVNVKTATETVQSTASVQPVLPEWELVPNTYLLDIMSIGDTVMLSVDARAEDCATSQPGFVCLAMNETSADDFTRLCGPFGDVCAAAGRLNSVSPGDSFAYLDTTDDSWYRARCLSSISAALVDGCKLVTLTPGDTYATLYGEYANVPEYCCVLRASGVALGNSLIATLVSKTAAGFKVSLANSETGATVGEGEVSRWLPDVDYPKPKPAVTPAPAIPEVPRPDVKNNSRVFVVEGSAIDRVLVRPADVESVRKFDALLEDVVLYGINAKPLTEPPTKGQTVIGVYTDGLYYRALCRRTNVKQNKYLLEYIEFGNSEVTQLDKLYPCPEQLTLAAQPTQVSLVRLQTPVTALTDTATQYLDKVRLDNEELVLTIPGGAASASTGAEVCLTIAKNKVSVNKRITEMCTPQWKKLEESGGDVIGSEVIKNAELEYVSLPAGACELRVLDVSGLECGTVSACALAETQVDYVRGPLAVRMAEYCESPIGREPYLPALMEVCIAKLPPTYSKWCRAVMVEHRPGDEEATVCFVDYGNFAEVPVSGLRKMMAEFVRGVPAVALLVEIVDFPSPPTDEQVSRALRHMAVTGGECGTLRVERCVLRVPGHYAVVAPELLAALRG